MGYHRNALKLKTLKSSWSKPLKKQTPELKLAGLIVRRHALHVNSFHWCGVCVWFSHPPITTQEVTSQSCNSPAPSDPLTPRGAPSVPLPSHSAKRAQTIIHFNDNKNTDSILPVDRLRTDIPPPPHPLKRLYYCTTEQTMIEKSTSGVVRPER